MNHNVDTGPLTKSEGGLNLLSTKRMMMAGIYSDCSTREIINKYMGPTTTLKVQGKSVQAERAKKVYTRIDGP